MLRNMSRVVAGFSFVIAAGLAYAAPILIVDVNGKLTSARNVDVDGIVYDVDFRDGTCVGLFSGCDNPATDFAFTTQADATAASATLLSLVLIDGPQGLFDSAPQNLQGCNQSLCLILTPYTLSQIGPNAIDAAVVLNFPAIRQF